MPAGLIAWWRDYVRFFSTSSYCYLLMMDRWTYRPTDRPSYKGARVCFVCMPSKLPPTLVCSKISIPLNFHESVADGPTNGRIDRRTNRPTDRSSYEDARTHLKTWFSVVGSNLAHGGEILHICPTVRNILLPTGPFDPFPSSPFSPSEAPMPSNAIRCHLYGSAFTFDLYLYSYLYCPE